LFSGQRTKYIAQGGAKMLSPHVTIPLASFMAIWVLLLLYAYFRPAKALSILEQDWMGLAALVVGILLVVVGDFVKGDWSTFSLVFGGLLAGFGLLVILPEGVTEKVMHPSNIGLILGVIGVVAFVYYGILPSIKYLGPAWTIIDQANTLFEKAFMVIWTNSLATQAVALFVTPFVVALGVFILLKGRKTS
jgi:hypothetical protein